MKTILTPFVICMTLTFSYSQQFNLDFGTELTQTRFRQFAPLVTVPFNNPHMPGYGLCANFSIRYNLKKMFSIVIIPNIGYYNTISKITSSYQINTYGMRVGTTLKKNHFLFVAGIDYSRLQSIIGTYKNNKRDMTYFAHRRNLWGPFANINYKILKSFSLNFRTTYFLKDFYSSGALDNNGDIVGPVEVTPFVLAVGVNYSISDGLRIKKEKNNRK